MEALFVPLWEHLGKYATSIALYTIVIFILYILIMSVVQHRRGDEVEFDLKLTKVTWKPNRELRKLEKDFDKISTEYTTVKEDLQHKIGVIAHIDQVGQHAQRLFEDLFSPSSNTEQVERDMHSALDYIFWAIARSVRSGKRDQQRIGIFWPDKDEKNLILMRGNGYSLDAQRNMCFPIDHSFVGTAFRKKEIEITGDLKNHPGAFVKLQGQHKYNSLICLPIIFNGDVFGILNVDAEENDGFTEMDVDILQYFANQLALLMFTYRIVLNSRINQQTGIESAPTDEKGAGQ